MTNLTWNFIGLLAQESTNVNSLSRILIWVMLALVVLLVLRVLYKLVTWLFRRSSTRSKTPPQQQRPEAPPSAPAEPSPASSILEDDWNTPGPGDSSRVRMTRQQAEQLGPPNMPWQAADVREPGFVEVAASREAHELGSMERSWTSRSLFGKPITGTQQDLPRIEPSEIPFADSSDYQFGGVTPALASLLPESDTRKQTVKQELRHAGYYNPHAYENLAAVRYLGLMLPILIFGVLLVLAPTQQLEMVMVSLLVVGAILGWALPRLFVRSRANRRKREIEQALPDVLDLLNMCVSQGMTLHSALSRVGQEITETYPAMAQELRIVTEQANLGTLEQALSNMNARVDSPELHSLSSLLIQTERMGTNVSDALTDYSDGMRASLQQRADQKANAATFKLLFPTVLCLMPAVYLFLLGPAIVELSDFFQRGGLDRYRQTEVRSPQE